MPAFWFKEIRRSLFCELSTYDHFTTARFICTLNDILIRNSVHRRTNMEDHHFSTHCDSAAEAYWKTTECGITNIQSKKKVSKEKAFLNTWKNEWSCRKVRIASSAMIGKLSPLKLKRPVMPNFFWERLELKPAKKCCKQKKFLDDM